MASSNTRKFSKPAILTAVVSGIAILAAAAILIWAQPSSAAVRGNTIGNNGNFGIVVSADSQTFYSNNGIFRYDADGAHEKICADNALYLNYHDGWIYYSNLGDGGRLYRTRTDGTAREQLSDQRTESIEIIDGRVYYAATVLGGEEYTDDCGIYFIDPQGNAVQLSNDNAEHLCVYGDRIYFINKDRQHQLFSIKTDGTDSRVIVSGFVYSYDISDGWIYYASRESISKVRLNGSGSVQLIDAGATTMLVKDDYIYYDNYNVMDSASDSASFMRVKTDGTGSERLLNGGLMAINSFDDHTIVGVLYNATASLIKYDIETGEAALLE